MKPTILPMLAACILVSSTDIGFECLFLAAVSVAVALLAVTEWAKPSPFAKSGYDGIEDALNGRR